MSPIKLLQVKRSYIKYLFMNYYIIIKNEELSGVPTFLDAVLSENYVLENPMPPMNYAWRRKTPNGRKAPFPKELYLVSKNKILKSDYLNDFGGFIVSKELLGLIQTSNSKLFDKVILKTIGWKGENITNK